MKLHVSARKPFVLYKTLLYFDKPFSRNPGLANWLLSRCTCLYFIAALVTLADYPLILK